jgi:cytochrome c biogenesis protein CcdA
VGTTGATPTGASGSGSGVTGTTGAAAPAGGSTHTSTLGTIGFVPSGAPETGFGGAAQSGHDYLLLVGSVLLIAMGLAVGFVLRRRRTHPEQISDDV